MEKHEVKTYKGKETIVTDCESRKEAYSKLDALKRKMFSNGIRNASFRLFV